MSRVLNHVEAILQHVGLRPADHVLVGLSGGVDSQVLTHALVSLERHGSGPHVRALHVNHRLRPESDRDTERVAAVARGLSVPFDVAVVDVDAWNTVLRQGIESAARAARYAALAAAARTAGVGWIAVGHTQNDQAETVLLRLARGTSLDGLGGMDPASRRVVPLDPAGTERVAVQILRPLLELSRPEIEAYAAAHGLEPVEDRSNQSLQYRRNRVRHQILPMLEEAVGGVVGSIARTAGLLRDDAEYLRLQALEAEPTVLAEASGVLTLAREPLRQLHPALQRRIVAAALARLAPERTPLTMERIEALREAVRTGAVSSRIELGAGITAYVDYETVAIGLGDELLDRLRRLSGLPLMLPASSIEPAAEFETELMNGWRLRVSGPVDSFVWSIRVRKPGDRILTDTKQETRLQDWLVNRKVPGYVRDWLPLLAIEGVIRWVGGVSPPEFCDERTGVVVRLESTGEGG